MFPLDPQLCRLMLTTQFRLIARTNPRQFDSLPWVRFWEAIYRELHVTTFDQALHALGCCQDDIAIRLFALRELYLGQGSVSDRKQYFRLQPRHTWATLRTQIEEIEDEICKAVEQEYSFEKLLSGWLSSRIEIPDNDLLEWVKSNGPEDWHTVVAGWNWDHGIEELDWIVSQPQCDKASAAEIYIVELNAFPDNTSGLIEKIGRNWNKNFYKRSFIRLNERKTQDLKYIAARLADRGIEYGQNDWCISIDEIFSLADESHRRWSRSRYCYDDGELRYSFKEWKRQFAATA